MDERQWILVLGETEISEGVLSVNITPDGPAGEGVDSADVLVLTASLVAAKPDYQAQVQLFSISGSEQEPEFTGIVEAVSPNGDVTTIALTTRRQLLAEMASGGLGIDPDTDPLEAVWSLLRLWGFNADEIDIEGFELPPPEMFEVATSLEGIELTERVGLGEVLLLPVGLWSRLADGLGPEDLWKRYSEATAWALTLVQARTRYEAETKGLQAIDVALAWLATRAHYSTAVLPGDQPRTFRRSWTLSRVTRRDVVVIKQSSTGRRWMRAPADVPFQPTLALSELENLLAVIPLPVSLPLSLRQALLAWRRAAESEDPFECVVALWEAVESYTADITVDALFSKEERKSIIERASEGLEEGKAKRVDEVLNNLLNKASAMLLVEIALRQDKVPLANEELAVLRRLRVLRNDLIHGRASEVPSSSDLKHAIAIVARMLVYRMNRITSDAGNTGLWIPSLK